MLLFAFYPSQDEVASGSLSFGIGRVAKFSAPKICPGEIIPVKTIPPPCMGPMVWWWVPKKVGTLAIFLSWKTLFLVSSYFDLDATFGDLFFGSQRRLQ